LYHVGVRDFKFGVYELTYEPTYLLTYMLTLASPSPRKTNQRGVWGSYGSLSVTRQ